MSAVRDFLASPAGKVLAIVLCLVAVASIFFSLRSFVRPSDAALMSRERWFVCTETGKAFKVTREPGMKIPVKSPFSGRETGLEADEECYWNADGTTRDEPTHILMNKTIGKTGPTFCPDCGRLVVKDNPTPAGGSKPPPTKEEYEARRRLRGIMH